ncbi:SRPBCC family protein [Actinoplanes sp. NPDC049681]|uniref:SRPBCC family protein n=1 Tax=Actinoplanes sp. NPDC049681 TaxID=3363905 RepID=UPI0037999DD4
MPAFDITTAIAATPEQLFDLSLDVGAHTASMSGSGERIVAGVRSGQMRLGDEVTWSARHFGVRWRMTSRITAYSRPERFVDEQVRGPFRRWHHEHLFSWDPEAGVTVMRDVIAFVAPVGVVSHVLLGPYMKKLIEQRNAHLADSFS